MDHIEFSRRLRVLAGNSTEGRDQGRLEVNQILGRLGFARLVRQTQAVVLALVIAGIGLYLAHSTLSSAAEFLGCSLALAGLTIGILRRFPYRNPEKSLSEGLIALSNFELNDSSMFLGRQRTNCTAVNNTLLSDLCMQLANDQG
jgi:hypothetical protein